eukprot:90751-Lingulodinium_polyedra.AAC.1
MLPTHRPGCSSTTATAGVAGNASFFWSPSALPRPGRRASPTYALAERDKVRRPEHRIHAPLSEQRAILAWTFQLERAATRPCGFAG